MPRHRRRPSIALRRIAIARVVYTAAALVGLGGCSDPSAGLTVSAVAATDGQTGVTGAALPQPLQVQVRSDGTPQSGVTVTWQASSGTIVSSSSFTDASGMAYATWTLGPVTGAVTATTTVAGADGSPVLFRATAVVPAVTATADSASIRQTAVVGRALPQALKLRVQSGGVPKAGVTVRWHARAGSVAPSETVTDANGFTSATWTLDTTAGVTTAQATIADAQAPVYFVATAVPDQAIALTAVAGDNQTSSANHDGFSPLTVAVTDRYGNGIAGQTVAWTVKSGPVSLGTRGQATDAQGRTFAIATPRGLPGTAVVQAVFEGDTTPVSFRLTLLAPAYYVVLQYQLFLSSQNGSHGPAVDTIPAGATMTWVLEPFDYDEHRIVSVGRPSFNGGDLPYAFPSEVRATFPTRGTYRYADFYYPENHGTVVVR